MQHIMREHAEKNAQRFIEHFKKEVGPVIEERVKKGVKDGVASIPSREVLRETTRTMAKTGVDIVGDTLKPFLGRRGPNRSDQKPRKPSEFDTDD